jgi:type VI protein secretion system component VasK
MSGSDLAIAIATFVSLILTYSWVTTERFRSAQHWNQIQRVVNDARNDIELAASRRRHPAGKALQQKI